ncbi:hypothetical protein SCHPADRAFT_900824 [Schizopora paradoxa]|uniref:LsmAD domain-containing protein n=1 Tax=Schizopora paradoxa TaxID=27342 RepID=A0A0H2SJB1_9AGAM|nr:hypothetical protein SCHPADRAFT_900824 [Schizopora paradoxa]
MASIRTSKGAPMKKGPDGQGNNTPARRAPAWGPNRGSPSPAPQFNNNAGAGRGAGGANGFPPLAGQANGKPAGTNAWGSTEDKQQLLASLAGSINTVIIVTLKSNTRFEGTLTAVSPSASDDASLTLKNAKDLSNPQTPVKDTFKIQASNVQSFTPGAAPAANGSNKNADSFRTDTEISRQGPKRERELQAWQPDSSVPDPASALNLSLNGAQRDDVTFGPNAGTGGAWDQFATNEKLFGVTTSFNEDEYTTKLDRSAKDYKEKEKRAEKIAAEITGSAVTNPHIAEERNLNVDDSGVNEEDKYSTVVRSANAYVPPGARRTGSSNPISPPPTSGTPSATSDADGAKGKQVELPKVAVNGPDGPEKVLRPSPSPSGGVAAKQSPADALPAFRDFVTNEKQRLTQKKQALVKNEMERRVAELKKFSASFKLNKPIPDDLVPILAKDEAKQKAIREKSEVDAKSNQARSIGISASILNASQTQKSVAPMKASSKVALPPSSLQKQQTAGVVSSKSSNVIGSASAVNKGIPSSASVQMEASKTVPRISMVIQPIPPFRGGKKSTSNEGKPTTSAASGGSPAQPLSPTSAQRLNVNASAFRPNPKAVAFTPVTSNGPSPSGSNSPAPPKKAQETVRPSAPQAPNPFFGTQTIKKSQSVSVKDDFNPFKHGKGTPETSQVGPNWPYTGKRYMQMFPPPPAPPTQQASPHMASHGPAPPPPPSYDEDAAAQAASRGYAVYAYAPYGYPGQHPPQMMAAAMPGMPPGAFVPSPYMQHMPYPPNMPPPNGQPMYAPPPMGQMPPPQQYMQPPPPGAYPPPPPNGAAGRPSMPPTPIPAHAHPYYHQSPQMQHAVPYPMMMPPPGPNGPPMQYESGPPPPVPMGGVGHA